MTWGIWCEVWGGRTGSRQAWLKSNGRFYEFDTLEEAEAVAKHLNEKTGLNPYRTAEFCYSVRPLP